MRILLVVFSDLYSKLGAWGFGFRAWGFGFWVEGFRF